MGQPSYLCSVLFARAPVLGLCFFVSVKPTWASLAACVIQLLLDLSSGGCGWGG